MSKRITHVLKVEYDGTNYSGWQRQKNGLSIQHAIEQALYRLTGHEIHVLGSGRTDAGVHAKGQVAHFKTTNEVFSVPESKIVKAINSRLPNDVRILSHCLADASFHCTRDAVYREYSYTFTNHESVFERHFATYYPYPFSIEKLISSNDLFVGEHDFTSFSKKNPSTLSYICNVKHCAWRQINDSTFILRIGANRFVYGMVRSIVGAMLEYSRGTLSSDEIIQLLHKPERISNRKRAPLASPEGLVLEKVHYPDHLGIQLL